MLHKSLFDSVARSEVDDSGKKVANFALFVTIMQYTMYTKRKLYRKTKLTGFLKTKVLNFTQKNTKVK